MIDCLLVQDSRILDIKFEILIIDLEYLVEVACIASQFIVLTLKHLGYLLNRTSKFVRANPKGEQVCMIVIDFILDCDCLIPGETFLLEEGLIVFDF